MDSQVSSHHFQGKIPDKVWGGGGTLVQTILNTNIISFLI
jgi:hypothetical protein